MFNIPQRTLPNQSILSPLRHLHRRVLAARSAVHRAVRLLERLRGARLLWGLAPSHPRPVVDTAILRILDRLA